MERITCRGFAAAVIALVAATAPSGNSSAAETTPGALVGIWGAERVFAPTEPVRVVVYAGKEGLRASALGASVPVSVDADAVAFTLPAGLGSFRGTRAGKDAPIVGHWVSEPGVIAYSPYATPVTLTRVSAGSWSGVVRPIQQPFSVYIAIVREADGALRAFLRNPERNQGVYTRLHSVERNGSRVRFTDADGAEVLVGTLDDDATVLSVPMPWRGGTYDLSRRDRANAPGFYPHVDNSAYRYLPPVPLGDGWRVDTADAAGLDSRRLSALVQSIRDTDTTSLRTPYIQSLLVARRGKLVLEEYFYGFHGDKPRDLRSSTKSITGILVGQAIDETPDLSLTTPLATIFPGSIDEADTRKRKLNLDHLLSMRSGFDCDDNDYDTPGNEDRMHEQEDQPDWIRVTLGLPMVAEPGERAVYCSAGINLLGGVISQTTGVWLPEFFRIRLAEPLQISHYHMNLDPLQRGYAGGGMHIRPRDFLKVAQLMLGHGTWNGRRLVSAAWVDKMLEPHASIYAADDYGFTWWRGELPFRDGVVQAYSATGNGGQLLVIVPELDIAIGFTGGNYGDFRTWIAWRDKLVPAYILDAVAD